MAAFVILTLYASTILNIKTFKSSASAYENESTSNMSIRKLH